MNFRDDPLETALDKDRERRYATALDLAEDLRRVRCFEPITARPAGPLTKLARWCRRSPALAASLFGLFAVLTAGLVVAALLLEQKDGALSTANAEREAKVIALNDFERLAVVSHLKALEAEREDVWPLTEENHLRRKEWLSRAETLATALPQLEAVLEHIRTSGESADASGLAADTRKAHRTGHVDLTFGALAPPSEAADSQPTSRPPPRRWRFMDAGLQFKNDVLSAFVEELRSFATANRYHRKLVGMRRQNEESDRFLALMNGEHRPLWNEAVTSIRDTAACPLYNGLRIRPQFGLVPIGRNPQSGLWEFMDLGTRAENSGSRPTRNPDGTLLLNSEHGVVFVLMPAGHTTFPDMWLMYTDGDIDRHRNDFLLHDQRSSCDEAHHVIASGRPEDMLDRTVLRPPVSQFGCGDGPSPAMKLDPFLLSKYELTQSQWFGAVGMSRLFSSKVRPASRRTEISAEHTEEWRQPISGVSQYACLEWARLAAMQLPTRAQWKYGCEAGTATPWWTGSSRDGLYTAAHLYRVGLSTVAPAGTLRANAFGLHDTHGNVWEWCLDYYVSYSRDVTMEVGNGTAATCGGSFRFGAAFAKSDFVYFEARETMDDDLGFRPARRIKGP